MIGHPVQHLRFPHAPIIVPLAPLADGDIAWPDGCCRLAFLRHQPHTVVGCHDLSQLGNAAGDNELYDYAGVAELADAPDSKATAETAHFH